ncbi:MAG: extracellular solute-binding protein [Defluviitaleaceae bacterium]|nr:extracellular solute-binding protein [Defluviitaleaceae bacterium]
MSFKNKKSLFFLGLVSVFTLLLVACGDGTGGGAGAGPGLRTDSEGRYIINARAFTNEIPHAVELFMYLNPEYAERYYFDFTVISDQDNAYSIALDPALEAGGLDMPHFFTAESAFVLRYTQGTMAAHALPYSELIPDLDARIAEAGIAPFTVEIGTRNDEIVGLAFQSTGGAMIYRRSIAESVFGTDDPDEIASITGENGWDSFLDAARELESAGYAAVVGAGDLWQAIRTTGSPWVVDGELVIDPARAEMMELHRALYEDNLMIDGGAWSDDWFAAMGGTGDRDVFSFFGPAWLINHVMVNNVGDTYGDWAVAVPPAGFFWGGTWVMANANVPEEIRGVLGAVIEWITLDATTNGFQYKFANGTFERALYDAGITNDYSAAKDVVASSVVMDLADGTIPLLGGQDMFAVFAPAASYATGAALTQYDVDINNWFLDQSEQYAIGEKTFEEAMNDFKQMVADNTTIIVNFD